MLPEVISKPQRQHGRDKARPSTNNPSLLNWVVEGHASSCPQKSFKIASSQTNIRALILLSGGLDSQLAAVLLKSQGIQATGITFKSIFFDAQAGIAAAARLNIPLKVIDFNDTIISLIEHPRHGFGAGLNPCIDCHAAMIRQAGKIMRAEGFLFVATGEVMNERPMSQNRRTLQLVAEESGLEGYLLRPLSAKLLEITEPEKRKWVNREKLLSIEGRSRKPQLALAREFGLTQFPQPAGGCLLTDPGYGKRLRDLRKHEGLRDTSAIQLLRTGRHFRLGNLKLIVGRNQANNEILERRAGNSTILLKTINVPGPVAVIPHTASEMELRLAGPQFAPGIATARQMTRLPLKLPTGKERALSKYCPPNKA